MSDPSQCNANARSAAGQPAGAAGSAAVPSPANDSHSCPGHLGGLPLPGGAGGGPPGIVPPPEWVAAEVRASAHMVRGLAVRLLALADLLPLPPDEVLDALGSAQAFARYPAYELHADVYVAVKEHLLPSADSLEEAGERPLGSRPDWSRREPDTGNGGD